MQTWPAHQVEGGSIESGQVWKSDPARPTLIACVSQLPADMRKDERLHEAPYGVSTSIVCAQSALRTGSGVSA